MARAAWGKGWLAVTAALGLGAPPCAALAGCKSCAPQPAAVAKLAALHGTATRSGAAASNAWSAAPVGATFVIGDALHTGGATSARVDLVAGGELKLGENTLVRFLAHADPSGVRGVGVETGEAEVETGAEPLGVQTPMGLARFEPNSTVRIKATETDARFDVVVGKAEIEGDAGVVTTAEASQRVVVTWGQAMVESSDAGGLADARAEAAGASEGGDDAGLAALEADVRGAGVRSAAKGSGTLTALPEGRVDMAEGSRLVVPEGATVAVTRGDERAVIVGQADVIVGRPGGPLLESRVGQVVLTSQTAGTRIDVPGGSIILTEVGPGSRQAEVRVDRQATHVIAEAGQVELRGRAGSATVSSGESGAIDARGAAVVESSEPTVADLDVPSGESSSIHSPRGVADVRIHVDGVCDGDALIEVTSGRGKRTVFVHAGGAAAAIVALGTGSYADRVRCVDAQGRPGEARARATLQVVHDSGAQTVPRTAPHDFVDADGRHYSVLYQNLLPQITMRWPRAPQGAKTSAHLDPGNGKVQVFPASDGASVTAGALAEGSYRFWFEVDGDPATRSPDTTLRVAFDNAAPAAELLQPIEGKATAGTVEIGGIAVEGASISVDGHAIALDPAFRFHGEVIVGGGTPPNRSIAVRISHPTHGVHYYLRTIGGG
jgi:hypothetical protein